MRRRNSSSFFVAVLALTAAVTAPAYARDTTGIRYADIPAGAYAVVAEVRAGARAGTG